jgi:hypothetical protein
MERFFFQWGQMTGELETFGAKVKVTLWTVKPGLNQGNVFIATGVVTAVIGHPKDEKQSVIVDWMFETWDGIGNTQVGWVLDGWNR